MKGQHQIVSEVLIFSVGIVMLIIITGEFDTLRKSMEDISVSDNMKEISDMISYSLFKLSLLGDNASVSVKIPPKLWTGFGPSVGDFHLLSGIDYSIKINNDKLILTMLSGPRETVYGSIFKLEKKYNIICDAKSNLGYITIKKFNNNINIVGGSK